MTDKTGKENTLFNFFNDFLRVGQKIVQSLRRKFVSKTTAATQLSVIGQMISSAFSVILGNLRHLA